MMLPPPPSCSATTRSRSRPASIPCTASVAGLYRCAQAARRGARAGPLPLALTHIAAAANRHPPPSTRCPLIARCRAHTARAWDFHAAERRLPSLARAPARHRRGGDRAEESGGAHHAHREGQRLVRECRGGRGRGAAWFVRGVGFAPQRPESAASMPSQMDLGGRR
jgi:hypothetical protein